MKSLLRSATACSPTPEPLFVGIVYKPVTIIHSETAAIRAWHEACFFSDMLRKIARLFVIKTRFEACAVIYALAVGAVTRGFHYVQQYPGFFGWLLFAACTAAVFMAGAKILEVTRKDSGDRRRRSDLEQRQEGSPQPG